MFFQPLFMTYAFLCHLVTYSFRLAALNFASICSAFSIWYNIFCGTFEYLEMCMCVPAVKVFLPVLAAFAQNFFRFFFVVSLFFCVFTACLCQQQKQQQNKNSKLLQLAHKILRQLQWCEQKKQPKKY